MCCQWFLKDKIKAIQSIYMSGKANYINSGTKICLFSLVSMRWTKLTFDSNSSYPSPLVKYQILVTMAHLQDYISSPVARKSPDWGWGMHYSNKWHFKSWVLGYGGQVLLCLISLKDFMLQQSILHIVKTRSLFTKCSWVINTIHTSVKSSLKKAKDKSSLAEVLIQSPLKWMKGLPLPPAGIKLYLKELW